MLTPNKMEASTVPTAELQVSEILYTQISYYERVNWVSSNLVKTFGDFIYSLTNGEHIKHVRKLREMKGSGRPQKDIKAYKAKYLPVVTISGKFHPGRNDAGLISHSNLLCVDIDGFKNIEDAEGVQDILRGDGYIVACFLSATGNLAAIIRVDGARHRDSYLNAAQYFYNKYRLKTDPLCINESRTRFLSEDQNYHLVECPDLVEALPLDEEYLARIKIAEKSEAAITVKYADADLQYVLDQIEADPRDIAPDYEPWIKMGYGFANEYKERGLALFQQVSRFHPDYDQVLIEKTIWPSMMSGVGRDRQDSQKASLNTFFALAQSKGYRLPEKLKESIPVQYEDSPGVIKLTEGSFGYGLYKFHFSKENKIVYDGIYRDGVLRLLAENGFRKLTQSNKTYILIRVVSNIAEEVDHVLIKDFVRTHIKDLNGDIEFVCDRPITLTIEKLTEDFLTTSHLIFNHTFLSALDEHLTPFLRDKATTMFFPFKNTVIEITNSGHINQIGYSILENLCVWKKQIIDHEVNYDVDSELQHECHFANFISNVCGRELDKMKAFRSAIGYLLHNYSSAAQGQAVILNDETITNTSRPQGGTGKGLFLNAIKKMRDLCMIDGKKFDPNERFCFQGVRNSTQIIAIDDLKNKVPFDRFNSVLTEGFEIERKNMESQHIEAEDSPKLVISSNYILECEGTTRKRRQFVLEFGDHYSSKIKKGTEQPIIKEHGGKFFSADWDQAEWNSFYSYMLESAWLYITEGFCLYENKNILKNRMKQLCGDDFYEWAMGMLERKEIVLNGSYQVKPLFEEFKNEYYGYDDQFSQRKFTTLLNHLASAMEWELKRVASHGVINIAFFER